MSEFIKANLSHLSQYVPGEQLNDRKYIKLNTNESPYPPGTAVQNCLTKSNIQDLRLYCDPECKSLITKLATIYNVNQENIFISNGSDEILNFAFMAYGENGVVFPDITYGFYKVFANLYQIKSEIIPLEKDYQIDCKKLYNKNKLIVIANPNAPTGLVISKNDIENILSNNKNNVVIIDEAYVDFGSESCKELIYKYTNLIVVRTYSKSRSLAGARLGFAFANKSLINDLNKIKYSTNPYNVNSLTQLLGEAALSEDNYYKDNCKKIISTREHVIKELEMLGFYVTQSKANFLFIKSDAISGSDLYYKLRNKGILIRHFEEDRISDFNRVTIGSFEQMTQFLKAIKDILKE